MEFIVHARDALCGGLAYAVESIGTDRMIHSDGLWIFLQVQAGREAFVRARDMV